MATVKMYLGSNFGGLVNGNYGTYTQGTDGTATVDVRDAPALLAAGATFLMNRNSFYTSTAVATATAARFIASATITNGALAVANQPDVARQGRLVVQTGTAAITGGTATISYIANDGSNPQLDVFSLVAVGTTTTTFFTSKGIVHLNTGTVAGLVGGATPLLQMDSTTTICVPVDPGTAIADVTFLKENTDGTDGTVGTASTSTLGGITPTTAPNNTHTYSWMYSFITRDI